MSVFKRGLFVLGVASLVLATRVGAQTSTSNPVKDQFEAFAGHYASLLLAAFDSISASK